MPAGPAAAATAWEYTSCRSPSAGDRAVPPRKAARCRSYRSARSPAASWQRCRAALRKWASVSRKSASTSALNTMRISRSVASGSPEALPSSQAGREGGAAGVTSGTRAAASSIAAAHPACTSVSAAPSSFFRSAPAGRPPWWPLTAAANTPTDRDASQVPAILWSMPTRPPAASTAASRSCHAQFALPTSWTRPR